MSLFIDPSTSITQCLAPKKRTENHPASLDKQSEAQRSDRESTPTPPRRRLSQSIPVSRSLSADIGFLQPASSFPSQHLPGIYLTDCNVVLANPSSIRCKPYLNIEIFWPRMHTQNGINAVHASSVPARASASIPERRPSLFQGFHYKTEHSIRSVPDLGQ